MNPQIVSTLSTLFVALCGGGLAAIGITTADGQATVAHAIIGALVLAAGSLTTWWKARQHTPTAQIAAVNNADNGVKVVAQVGPGVPINQPIK